jgi:tRNA pseudouridine(55) synthase
MSRRPDADVPPGLLLVDKAGGMTSHDVVARARRVLSVRKVGHAGTLDPMATGLLVLGVGTATRLLGYVGGHDKTYEATIRLGQSTVSDDREGEVLATSSTAHVDDDAVRAALAAQTGPLQQVPSSVSAVKVEGRRSYDRVRAGEAVELAPRSVTVHRLDVLRVSRPEPDLIDVDVTVTCTAGTYIRAIARDVPRPGRSPSSGRLPWRRPAPRWPPAAGRGSCRSPRPPPPSSPPGGSPSSRRGRSPTGSGSRPREPPACTRRSIRAVASWPCSRTPVRPPG